jgi:hypothetical protein
MIISFIVYSCEKMYNINIIIDEYEIIELNSY